LVKKIKDVRCALYVFIGLGNFMKKFLSILMLLFLIGCTSFTIPNYIHDKHPSLKTFYVPYDQVHAATLKVLGDLGWRIEKEADPALYERGRHFQDASHQQTLIFTDINQFSFFAGSRFSRLNVFLHVTADKATEVEVRYLKVTSIMFKAFYNYKNDRLADRIFERIEKELNL